ncbi:hypothetical protein CI610_02237 [invertebrate metagenome]|uniref:Methylase n=1 Tax=invertebrate metagenome TaxID=1711999 RepID=A0A2H9T6J2_9ZZZZ
MAIKYSQACENNKKPILEVLARYLYKRKYLLEIGSGTGQHSEYFTLMMPWLIWQPSDVQENIQGLTERVLAASLPNLSVPVVLDVWQKLWPLDQVDAVFSANTAHIMDKSTVQHMFLKVGEILESDGLFCLYGPFNYGGHYTSDSNRIFDQQLKIKSSLMGIRHNEWIQQLADDAGLSVCDDIAMPANNRLLIWKK